MKTKRMTIVLSTVESQDRDSSIQLVLPGEIRRIREAQNGNPERVRKLGGLWQIEGAAASPWGS
jgi:hypothetical protein